VNQAWEDYTGRHIEQERGLLWLDSVHADDREAVERDDVRVVVIDSLNGYLNAMPDERFLILQLHELLTYLGHRNVVSILTLAQHGILGTQLSSPLDISYMADTVLLLRYFEALGRVRRAMSVVKKRTGAHEDTIREFRINNQGIALGQPLEDFQGVLRGVPTYVGSRGPLMGERP
jgi:circadian clock protein KaiC